MKILLNNTTLFESLRPFNDLGFVPTMGGIHKGHLSLINKSNKLCKKTIVSIFVNPKQFNNKKDLKSYPQNIKKDLKILKKSKKVDFVYLPKFKDIYKDKKKSKITLQKKDKILCAKFRKGHFEGVLDVMNKLTKIVKPKKIFMGEKDFQQLYLVKKELEKKYKTKIIPCKTIRDKDNVALSSRNLLLNKSNLIIAAKIYETLVDIKKNTKNKKNIPSFLNLKKRELKKLISELSSNIEGLKSINIKNLKLSNTKNNSRLFIAYYLKNVRLIDNL
jgi:pantoate--beta-alanine ligase